MTGHTAKPRFRVVPACSGSLAPSRAFADAEAALGWANLISRRYGVRMDVWSIDTATGRGPLLESFAPKP